MYFRLVASCCRSDREGGIAVGFMLACRGVFNREWWVVTRTARLGSIGHTGFLFSCWSMSLDQVSVRLLLPDSTVRD